MSVPDAACSPCRAGRLGAAAEKDEDTVLSNAMLLLGYLWRNSCLYLFILSVFRNTVDIAWASSHVFIVNLQYPSHCGVYYHTYIIGSIALGACKSTHTKNTIKLTAMLANTCLLRLLHPPHFDNASPVTTDDPSSKRGIYTRQCSNTILMRL